MMRAYFPNFTFQDPAINQLRKKIRYGLEEDNPGLLSLWLSMEDSALSNNNPHDNWQSYCAQFNLLIDVLSDDLIPKHWRANCLNTIYNPLCSLQRNAINPQRLQQLNKLYVELRVVSNFFQQGLS